MSETITLSQIKSLPTLDDQVGLLMDGLNPGQLEAAMTLQGAVAAIAGAGSGKTHAFTRRICHMLLTGIPATQIFAVTFTNKGAAEIVERLEGMIGPDSQFIAAGTFHSLIYRHILKAYATHPYLASINLDMNECAILDEDEADTLRDEAIKSLDEKHQEMIKAEGWAKSIKAEMEQARSRGLTAEAYAKEKIGFGDENDILYRITVDVWTRYSALCRVANGIDFNDILVTALSLMKKDPTVGQELAVKFRYLMLDEYQDTNPVQMQIIDDIAKHHGNIFVVGDEKQAIYSFRGSDITIILEFKKRYPNAVIVEMDYNYRSTGPILEAANCIARHMSQRVTDGQLLPGLDFTGQSVAKVSLVEFESDREEARMLAMAIQRDLTRGGMKGKDIAVIYRSRLGKALIEQELVKKGIDYHVVGDISFYQRAEVKNAISLLRYTFRPWDSVATLRLLKNTSFGVSDVSAKKSMAQNKQSANAYLVELSNKTGAKSKPTAVAQKLKPMLTVMQAVRRLVAYDEDADYIRSKVERLWEIYMSANVKKAAEKDSGPLDEATEARMTNVKFLFDRFFGELKAGRKPEDILDELAMMSDGKNQTERDKQNMVNLLTMHASKGLEFPYVYLPCMDDDTTPGQKNDPVEDFDALEEERRIAYVGFTRARMKLSVSYAKKKAKHGKILDVKASPWVREVSLGTNNPILKYRAAASLPSPSR